MKFLSLTFLDFTASNNVILAFRHTTGCNSQVNESSRAIMKPSGGTNVNSASRKRKGLELPGCYEFAIGPELPKKPRARRVEKPEDRKRKQEIANAGGACWNCWYNNKQASQYPHHGTNSVLTFSLSVLRWGCV